MRNRLLLVALPALEAIVVWLQKSRTETSGPRYDGRSVKYWVQKYTRHPRRDTPSGGFGAHDPVLQRVLEIGTNAIPLLLLELDYESLISDGFLRIATLGIRDFGQNDIRINAEMAVKEIGGRSLPLLLSELNASDGRMRKGAASVLHLFHKDDVEVIPALIRALQDAEFRVRGHDADSLGRIGLDAKPAVTPLLAWLKADPSFVTLLVVSGAVRKIDPQNQELRAILMELAEANEIGGLGPAEIRFLNQHASRILAEIKRGPIRPASQ
ncbi:MAG: hypothetical protein FJ398_23645 [Verrucomicrobia bacterium]|nr:hypothetical protein [Verrucomicrobiota bacterium]